ncbi:MAG: hypothetical protein QF689_17025 [Candidatus Latescibacteria bacterium]|jgi:hypothetical protein|nr:hypothetical protein [Candidatus Latescibacterota bacterium]HJP31321.1 hypothetical protein [Candidatus Latescibacterota bacterium]
MRTHAPALLTILSILLASSSAHGHNGAVTFAVPVSGIIIDGDLSDWPPVAETVIERVGLGDTPEGPDDFRANLRAACDAPGAALYVAVEVFDDDLVAHGESPASMRQMVRFLRRLGWRSQDTDDPPSLPDGCAVIIDVGHEDGDSRVVRFAHDGRDHRYLLTSSERDSTEWRAGDVAVRFTEDRRVYEWRIDLADLFLRRSDTDAPDIAPGSVFGFDVTIADADGDGSLSWMTWGPGVGKMWGSRFGRRGDVVLVQEAMPLRRLSGRALWSDSLAWTPPASVRAEGTQGGARWVVATDSAGTFELQAPAGEYLLSLDDPRLGLDRRAVRARIPEEGAAAPVSVVDRPLFRMSALSAGPATVLGIPHDTHDHPLPPSSRQRGVSWVGGRMIGRDHLASLEPLHVDWIVQTPFGWQRDIHKPTLQAPDGESGGWGESDRGVAITAALARQRGIATLLKPHLWTGRGTWRGELAMTSEQDWAEWFAQYERFIVHFARLAEANGIEGFCIGAELSATLEREHEWRQIIERVRQVYGGWIVYAANWTNFEDVRFWDAVDFIGVQAYFPLAEEPTADVDRLMEGWQPWLERLGGVAQRRDRRVLFTEIGYRTNTNAAVEPWLWERQTEGGGDHNGLKTQEALYEAFFRAAWSRPWVGGAYFWKWFPNHERAGGEGDDGFTPQRKPAQETLSRWYRRSLVLDSQGALPMPTDETETPGGE